MMEEKQEKIVTAVENLINEDRVIGFSDAVFAFAATLLVLKIDLPTLSQNELSSARLYTELINLWPSYFANIISFLIIAYYWLNHHALFSLIKKFNIVLIWLNIFFLIFISFIPFPVDLFGDYSNSEVIVAFYSFSISLVGFLLLGIWGYAVFKKLVDKNLNKKQINYYTLRFLIPPLIFTASIPLSFIDPVLAKCSWVLVVVGIFIINHFFGTEKNSSLK